MLTFHDSNNSFGDFKGFRKGDGLGLVFNFFLSPRPVSIDLCFLQLMQKCKDASGMEEPTEQ